MSETAAHDAPSADNQVPRETWAARLLRGVQRETCSQCRGEGERLNRLSAGLTIRRERRLLNYSAHAFARRLDVSTSYLCDLELGNRAWTPELFLRVAGVLDAIRAEQDAAYGTHCHSGVVDGCLVAEPDLGSCGCPCPGCTAERAR